MAAGNNQCGQLLLLQADLWSIGTILFELLAGKPPFNGANHVQLLRNIERNDAKLPDQVAARLSAPCISLLGRLLRRNPVERISFEELFSHPFLTGDAGMMVEMYLRSWYVAGCVLRQLHQTTLMGLPTTCMMGLWDIASSSAGQSLRPQRCIMLLYRRDVSWLCLWLVMVQALHLESRPLSHTQQQQQQRDMLSCQQP